MSGLPFSQKFVSRSYDMRGGCNQTSQGGSGPGKWWTRRSHPAKADEEQKAAIMAETVDIVKDNETLGIFNRTILCFAKTVYRTNGAWEGANPLTPILPMLIFQLTFAIIATRFCLFITRIFNQPPLVGEILGGILLGPSLLGRMKNLSTGVFPTYSFLVLEPMAHLALVFYAFLMGLDLDIRAIPRTGTKALRISIAGTIVPLLLTICLCLTIKSESSLAWLFSGIALSVTGFSALSQLLDKHSLTHTEIGKTALSSALLTEIISWLLLALALVASNKPPGGIFGSLVTTAAAILSCIYGVRAALKWIIRRTPEGQGYSEYYVCSILTAVCLVGVVMDLCGTHPMIGAFLFGLVIPNNVLEATLVERLEDFVNGILMPIFFAVCGLRTNIDVITKTDYNWIGVLLIIFVACAAKTFGTIAVAGLNNMNFSEAWAVGVLSNTKSMMAMIVLEVGQEQQALSTQTYTVLVFAILIMTMGVTPIISMQNPASRNVVPYKRKTIQNAKPEEELRVLACVHGMRNVPAVINLLNASNVTHRCPMSVFAVHMVELVGRASATLVVHSARKAGPRNRSYTEAQTEQIISAFDNYELRHDGVTVQALTAKSSYSSMDEDICNIARDKRVAFIILPFHKIHTQSGEMEDLNPAIRTVNENVLTNAPCSVAILIDRGLAESAQAARRIAMLYFGGPDDREALAYAWRMSEHPQVGLKVIRFNPSPEAMQMHMEPLEFENPGAVAVNIDSEREKVLDEEFLHKFKTAKANDKSVTLTELLLNDEEETIEAIKSMDGQHDLYVVGRGRGIVSPLTAGLTDWCDCPELGAIGDLLVTSEFGSAFSVVVVQQYARMVVSGEGSARSGSSINLREEMGSVDWRMSNAEDESEGFAPLTNQKRDQ